MKPPWVGPLKSQVFFDALSYNLVTNNLVTYSIVTGNLVTNNLVTYSLVTGNLVTVYWQFSAKSIYISIYLTI